MDAQTRPQLRKALLAAFDRDALEVLVRDGLGLRLERIAAKGATLDKEASDLIEWATAQHKLEALVQAALTKNPDDPALRAFAAEHFLHLIDPDAPAARPTSKLPEGMAPYRGLAAFEAEHALIFLGRDAEIDELVQRLEAGARLITVVAASGSGKSSLVRAGLLPKAAAGAFGTGPWATAVLVPGSQPCEALAIAVLKALPAAREDRPFSQATIELTRLLRDAAEKPEFAATLRLTASEALPKGTAGLLLVVDQFEELFTLSSGDERKAFVANLIEATRSGLIRVVLTMRADFTGHFLQEPALGAALLQSSAFYLGPMPPEQLRKVIETPAHLAGHRFEPGLVDELVRETLGEPGHLPLLAFTLDQLWQHRDTALNVLRWEAYRALGGLRGAINAHAEAVVAKLDPDQERLLRDLFGHLVTPGQGAADTRHRATRAELGEKAGPLIDALVSARLLTTRSDAEDRPEIEIAHEALIREWPRLRAWIDAEREGLVLRHQIEQAAAAWARDSLDGGNLWRGGRLRRAIELRDAGRPPLTAAQRAFVDSCQAAVAEEAEAEEERHRLTLEALVRAHDAVRLAVAHRLREHDPVSAALALVEVEEPGRLDFTLLLLVELATALRPQTVLDGHEGSLSTAVFSRDGQRIVTASSDGTARVWNADGSGAPVILHGHKSWVHSATFSPDDRRIVTASFDGTARVWNADGTGATVVLEGSGGAVWSATISPDGQRIATFSGDGKARIWNADGSGSPIVLCHEKEGWAYPGFVDT